MLQNNIKKLDNKFVLAPEERMALIKSKIERASAQLESMIAQIEMVKRIQQNSK
jgi:uncharacterized small protein (DUF1192 family)